MLFLAVVRCIREYQKEHSKNHFSTCSFRKKLLFAIFKTKSETFWKHFDIQAGAMLQK